MENIKCYVSARIGFATSDVTNIFALTLLCIIINCFSVVTEEPPTDTMTGAISHTSNYARTYLNIADIAPFMLL